ncbi:mitochondrial import inner membrane translocase subunit TIM16, putative [Hepatocystis sp. ex Piliocolobus tephrosceles]|nr:mitochondrial import inner membrane translocase subunit TIM16, putative [Hepatocystis sp. ex Piliocolobus tephrosceles]
MLPFRPLSQFVFQFFIITSTALGKAFIQAYKEVIKNKHNTQFIKQKYNSCMNIEEAINILNVDRNKIYKKLTKEDLKLLKEEITNRHQVLNRLNEKSGQYNGSVYIQKKAKVAKDILFQHLNIK